eukprot:g10794.t1
MLCTMGYTNLCDVMDVINGLYSLCVVFARTWLAERRCVSFSHAWLAEDVVACEKLFAHLRGLRPERGKDFTLYIEVGMAESSLLLLQGNVLKAE